MPTIGKSAARLDARAKVTGEALYPGDIDMPEQAYLKILFANRPHAIIERMDITRAETLPGVLAILTAKDVPVNEYGLITPDQPVLCGLGSNKPFANHVRFVGDQLAVIVAETEQIAEQARSLIDVTYNDLPVITDPLEAIKEDAVLLHPDQDSNIFCHYKIRHGNVENAFKEADVIVEGEYRTPVQEHAYLQPEAGVGYIDEEGRVTIQVAGQWTHEDQEQIAHALDLPLEQVRVIYPAIGGAFGGREDMSIQIVLALAALRLHQRGIDRPVKLIWNREESIIGHHKRHAYILRTRWGATKDGKVIAADVKIFADGGAYIYTSTKVMGNATLMCTGPYEILNVKVDSYAIYTNNIPGGAFRGFGGPQGIFAAEMQMNRLAEALGMDPVELRMKNALKDGSITSVGSPIPDGVSLLPVIQQCAQKAGWEITQDLQGQIKAKLDRSNSMLKPSDLPNLKRGLGFAAAYKNVGFSFGAPENCTAKVELHGKSEIEHVVVYHAAAEVGQGTHTAIAQMAAEAAGVSLDKVEMVTSDTATTGNSGSVSASRMTFMSGNSINGAVHAALEKWQKEERPAIAEYTYYPPRTTPYDPETGECIPNFSYGYVAQAVTIEVDIETGHVQILDVISVDDVGQAINPQQVEGQIEGAVVQAAGYAILENFIQKDGYVQTNQLSTYLIPTVLDIPENVASVIKEYPDPIGPFGARGVGEMPFISLPPAVMAAMYDATGVWFHEFPLTPQRVLKSLGKI
jgi:CO/xanthine dehydrogenase Mo-binding subunit